jgi:phage shock protein PspC (stress-responsive transcriptional regulator)
MEKKKQTKNQKLRLSQTNKKFLGVCGGLAEYLNADPTLMRALFILFLFVPTIPSIIIYVIMWFLMRE